MKCCPLFYCVPWGVGPFPPAWTWGRWTVRGAGTAGMESASLWEWVSGFRCMQSPDSWHGHKFHLSLRLEKEGFIKKIWLGAVGQVTSRRGVWQQGLSAHVCIQPGCMRARAGHAGEFELEHRLWTVQWVRGRRPVAKCSFFCLLQRPGQFQRLNYPWQQKVLIQPFLPLLSRLCLALKALFMAVCLPAGTLGDQELRGRTRLRSTEGGRDAVQ